MKIVRNFAASIQEIRMATTETILGTSRKLLNDIVWSHLNRPYNNLSNPSYAEVAFFIDV